MSPVREVRLLSDVSIIYRVRPLSALPRTDDHLNKQARQSEHFP